MKNTYQIIMLECATSSLYLYDNRLYTLAEANHMPGQFGGSNQHLYVLSNKIIHGESGHFYDSVANKITWRQNIDVGNIGIGLLKILASTDISITPDMLIPMGFVRFFAQKFNENEKVNFVELISGIECSKNECHGECGECNYMTKVFKKNSDNTLAIRALKATEIITQTKPKTELTPIDFNMMKAAKILQQLNPTTSLYKAKVKILAQLIENPQGGHILDKKLVKWANKVGIITELNCEDRTSWWTCRI